MTQERDPLLAQQARRLHPRDRRVPRQRNAPGALPAPAVPARAGFGVTSVNYDFAELLARRSTLMSLFEDTNPRALKDLLAEIHNRTTVLPDFQRDFVWEPGATQELIVSIANNYPAGSILRVRDAKRVFAAREFEGAPQLDGREAHLSRTRWPAAADLALPGVLWRGRAPLLPRPRQAQRWCRLRRGDLPRTRHHEVGEGPRRLRGPGARVAAAALRAEGRCRRLSAVGPQAREPDGDGRANADARGRTEPAQRTSGSRSSTTTTSLW